MEKCKSIMLLITYGCNLNCTYCYEPKTLRKKMSKEQAVSYIQSIVNTLDSSYTEFEVQFMGGEPLLEFNLIREVSEWLWQWNSSLPLSNVFVATNGTLLNDEMKEWFRTNRKRICCGLSFDGDVLMQNINRSNSSSMVDLQFFADNWPNQSVKMTISPDTISRLAKGVEFLVSNGLTHLTADLAMGNNIPWEDEHLKELWGQLEQLSTFYLDNPSLPPFSMLYIDVLAPIRKPKVQVPHCSCGENLVCVDTDGECYACHLFSPVSITKTKAKMSQQIDFCSKPNYYTDECLSCSLLAVCPHCYGMCYSTAGDLSTQSAFTCKSTKIIFLASCHFKMEQAKRNGDTKLQTQIEKIISNFHLS